MAPTTAVFSPAFGNRPSYLVGRESVVESFINGLAEEPGSRNRAVVLLGQRGSGKTVLLWELADRAAELGFVVAAPTAATEGMLERIVEKIQDDGERYIKRKRAARLTGGSLGAFGFSAGLEFNHEVQETKSFEYKLTQLARKLTEQQHGILILIDELQANSPEIRQLVTTYQELVGERLNVAIVLAGLPGAVSATLNDHVLTFLNRARKISLDPLKFRDIDAFYTRAFDELGIRMSPDLRAQAAEATKGSPYLLQLIGYNVANRATRDVDVSPVDVKDAIRLSELDFENDVCKTTISALSEKDVEFLEAMASDSGASRMADIAERMGVTQDYAQKYRRRLIDAGVIERERRGYVNFAVPYLREFLQREADGLE